MLFGILPWALIAVGVGFALQEEAAYRREREREMEAKASAVAAKPMTGERLRAWRAYLGAKHELDRLHEQDALKVPAQEEILSRAMDGLFDAYLTDDDLRKWDVYGSQKWDMYGMALGHILNREQEVETWLAARPSA